MNDEENKTKSSDDQQPRDKEALQRQLGQHPEGKPPAGTEADESGAGVMLVDKPPKRGTLEFKGPPGMAVSVRGDEWCTKIVIHLPVDDERAWTP